ncbi:MAG: hypothetical protein SLAVMIC_00141 [uncultured marine phage]|uniref:Uncharacterized protein n=1 Tax=uncultured marine phage TaxID=707152 RepID=A0A8D9CEN7_9VIRU|nr:MAG: hypothetical protein SLAVMIC_00141 [uncultured marine phage]
MSRIKTYKMFLEELNGPSNVPQFIFKGVNYGDGNNTPRDHFGDKNRLSTDTPQSKVSGDSFVLTDEEFMDQDEVKDLLRRYDIWCKQNEQDPIPLDNLDGKTIGYIVDLIGRE